MHCGHADPWGCRCNRQALTTESAVAAADHLLHCGLAPLFDIEQARTLWRAGHHDHAVRCTQQVSAA